jgi:hypothetical protein
MPIFDFLQLKYQPFANINFDPVCSCGKFVWKEIALLVSQKQLYYEKVLRHFDYNVCIQRCKWTMDMAKPFAAGQLIIVCFLYRCQHRLYGGQLRHHHENYKRRHNLGWFTV